ncbi:type VII secretion-associated serine protease mycosin [Dactylosporangium sp. CS-047395]|uniref:type VII secretion-associated serine protease mycosin n=1 Tax=Dactylosporangium sp. CS-047395 TaxID=3239936 RepID=UPI003D8E3925
MPRRYGMSALALLSTLAAILNFCPIDGLSLPATSNSDTSGKSRRLASARATVTLATLGARGPFFRAPSACQNQTKQPASVPSGAPWAQQRYDQTRLNALADGRGVVVAVIDSGVDARNPQLQGAVQPGPDQLDGGNSTLDCVGHGTGVAGIIAARPYQNSQFRGLAPAATILALRVTEQIEGDNGTLTGRRGTPAGLATAIRDAVALRARVINLSLVSYADEPQVRAAIKFAQDNDVVVVAAVGNGADQGNKTPYPAAYDGVIGVGSIAPDGQRVASSQLGPYVDLVAPGTQIVTTATPNGWTMVDGTSFAAPFVSATAALLRQYHPEFTAAQVTAQLLATADGGRAGDGYGAGVLNPYRALTELTGTSPNPPSHSLAQPAQTANKSSEAAATHTALTWALIGLAVVVLISALAVIVPKGRRRNWRPGLRELPPAPEPPPDRSLPAFDPHR